MSLHKEASIQLNDNGSTRSKCDKSRYLQRQLLIPIMRQVGIRSITEDYISQIEIWADMVLDIGTIITCRSI